MSNSRRFPWERDEEVLIIETPEQTEISLVLADLGSRFVALFVDLLILSLVYLMIFTVAGCAGFTFGREGAGVFMAALTAFLFVLFFLYFILYEVLWDGQTPGKRMAGIRVIQDSGRGLQWPAAVLRNVVKMVEISLPILMIVPFFTQGRRRVGDLLAGTYVVRVIKDAPPKKRGGLLRPAEADEGPLVFGFGEAQRKMMYEEDLDLLMYLDESLDGKRYSERKHAMQSVAERYILRFSMEMRRDEALLDPERFLRELGLQLRKRFEDRAF